MKTLIISALASFIIVLACYAPVLPAPQMGTVIIETAGAQSVYLDGLYMGETPQEITILENYPNYLQVGQWKFVLIPPCTYAVIKITPDAHPATYTPEEMVIEW